MIKNSKESRQKNRTFWFGPAATTSTSYIINFKFIYGRTHISSRPVYLFLCVCVYVLFATVVHIQPNKHLPESEKKQRRSFTQEEKQNMRRNRWRRKKHCSVEVLVELSPRQSLRSFLVAQMNLRCNKAHLCIVCVVGVNNASLTYSKTFESTEKMRKMQNGQTQRGVVAKLHTMLLRSKDEILL